MAKIVIQNPVVTLAGGTVSANVAQCTIAVEADDVETTNFAGGGWRERIGGLKAANVSFDFHQDYAAGAID
jgi:predicted secreted protein